MRTVLLSLIVLVALATTGCGSSVCAGTSCICPTGTSCSFDACDSSTSSCQFSCDSEATCTGTCGASCSVSCSGKSCTHTVGANSSVVCGGGTCNITCTGSCLVSGSANLTCQGGTKSASGCD